MPVSLIFENLEYGASIDEIIENYKVTCEQIQAVLEFAARRAASAPPPGASGHNGRRMGWARLQNGELLSEAEKASFELFLTADKNLRYQQNLTNRRIAIVVLRHSPWPLARLHIPEIVSAVDASTPGSYLEVDSPLPPKKPFERS
jgi:hypothetical protein